MMEQGLDRPFAELLERVDGRFWGKYRGLVEDVDDQQKLGRIVAKVPSVYGDELSPPCWPVVAFAGPQYGALMLPQKGDGVWIEFEDGDPSRPLWTGCWWGKNELPEPGGPNQRVIVTPGELKVVLDDEGKQLQLLHPKGEITLSDSNLTLRFGQTKIVLDDMGVTVNDGAFKVTK